MENKDIGKLLEEVNLEINESLPIGNGPDLVPKLSKLLASMNGYLTATSELKYYTPKENEELAYHRLHTLERTIDVTRQMHILAALLPHLK